MITNTLEQIRKSVTALGGALVSRVPGADFSDDIRRHFQTRYPIFLDGALPHGSDQEHLLRQARESLTKGGYESGTMPAAILREALDAVPGMPQEAVRVGKAAMTAISSRSARIWWEEEPSELEDVLGALQKPRPVMRFYDVTGLDPASGQWNHCFDIDIRLEEKARTVDFWSGDRTYVVEVGLAHADGRFLSLARTRPATLPRDGAGDAGVPTIVRSALVPRERTATPAAPDAFAREWVLSRPDAPDRDVEAEMIVHQLYRSFLRDGPRVLRCSAKPARRDPEVLRREFAQRQSKLRVKPAVSKRVRKKQPKSEIVVVRLDSRDTAANNGVTYFPVPARLGIDSLGYAPGDGTVVALCRGIVESVRSGRQPVWERRSSLTTGAGMAQASALFAKKSHDMAAVPVFKAAEALRKQLSGMAPIGPAVSEPIPVELPEQPEHGKRIVPAKTFGGAEARRFARAGVRINRMALTLEGRMRPGAKLKVAGQLVQADADGSFKVECVLSGRKAAIPLRAGTSIGGEVRSVINLDWEERSGRDRKTSMRSR